MSGSGSGSGSGAAASATSKNSVKEVYSCSACHVNFTDRQTQRAHMKDDWHVCNLKRRIDALPPISEATFNGEVLPETDATDASLGFQLSCYACGQNFLTQKAWQEHLKSRNHTRRATKLPVSPDETPEPSSPLSNASKKDEPSSPAKPFSFLDCLFCNVESTSLDFNISHMAHAHSFFIPNSEDLTDIDSLLGYLYTLISVFHECLFCGRLKPNRLAVQDHMCGKGHCRLDFSNDRHKFWQFYDIDDAEEKLPGVNLVPDDDELHLPSGKTVGSRSGARSTHRNSKRRSSSAPSLHRRLLNEEESEATPPATLDRRLIARAGTSTSMVGIPEVQRLALVAVERQMFAMEMRGQNERQSRVDKGGNRQKRYKVAGIGKKQGGLEKRLG
ncbi:hypothetical protein V501_01370 [Pseudogymnoascus sp. VKM F-4519 (FW-2642)]|nr:hypothetical protein V501_01370 [Pseudogymnoascus sp. VKM F-4519 (FW-2642)]